MQGETDDRVGRESGRAGLLAVAVGVGVGGVLARCRAPLSPGLIDVAGVGPAEAAWTRAAALAFAAIVVVFAGGLALRAPAMLLVGVALGAATRLIDPVDGSLFVGGAEPLLGLVPWGVLALAAAAISRRSVPRAEAPKVQRPALLVGLALGAAGVTVQIEGIARIARRLGLGGTGDDAVFAAVFAALAAVGGGAFGRGWTRAGAGRAAGALAAAAILTVLALPIAAGIAEPLGFKALCARFGADASLAGTPRVDAAVALTAFVLPALAVGTALHVARGRAVLAALLVGAALGTIAVPGLVESDPITRLTGAARVGAAGLVRTGAAAAGLGLFVFAAAAPGRSRMPIGAVGTLLAIASPLLPITGVSVLDPWERFPVAPTAVFETASGQFLIEPAGGRVRRVTLDQRPLSPRASGLLADAERIRASVDSVREESGQPVTSVLAIGLVTPERAATMAALGVTRVDRTAHWWRAMRLIEADLLAGSTPPAGSIVAPAVAGDHARDGTYDAVIVLSPGAHGALPLSRAASEELTHWPVPAVLWLDESRPTAHLPWTQRTLLASSGVESFSLALLSRASGPEQARGNRLDAPSLFAWMSTRPDERPRAAWRAAAARIAGATGATAFARGIARHAAVQRMSSPFESRAQRVELDPQAMASWRDHATDAASLSRFERGVVEGLARTIEGSREVPLAYEYIEPIADAHAPWPALVRTLAWADGEELEFEQAAARLAPLWASDPDDVRTARAYAAALLEVDRPAEAVAVLRPVSDARPEDLVLRTRLADALVAAKDPEGRRIAAELLRDDPRNPELFGLARGMRGMDTLMPDSSPLDGR